MTASDRARLNLAQADQRAPRAPRFRTALRPRPGSPTRS